MIDSAENSPTHESQPPTNKPPQDPEPDQPIIFMGKMSFEGPLGEYYQEKYGHMETQWKGEDPVKYLERLKTMFPLPDQTAYLDVISEIMHLGIFMGLTHQRISQGKEVPLAISSLFTFIPRQETDSHIWVQLDRAAVNSLFSSLHLLARYTQQREDQIVAAVRSDATSILKGEKPASDQWIDKIKQLERQIRVKLSETLVGSEMTEEVIRNLVLEDLTPHSLRLNTVWLKEWIDELLGSGEVGIDLRQRLEAGKLIALSLIFGIALDDFDIEPDVAVQLRNAWEAHFYDLLKDQINL